MWFEQFPRQIGLFPAFGSPGQISVHSLGGDLDRAAAAVAPNAPSPARSRWAVSAVFRPRHQPGASPWAPPAGPFHSVGGLIAPPCLAAPRLLSGSEQNGDCRFLPPFCVLVVHARIMLFRLFSFMCSLDVH